MFPSVSTHFKSSFVEFIAKVKMSLYIKVLLLISIIFSWEKYFKYELNFEQGESSYPMSNELDIFTFFVEKSPILDFYFIFSAISDLFNYILFVLVCMTIDIVIIDIDYRSLLTLQIFDIFITRDLY